MSPLFDSVSSSFSWMSQYVKGNMTKAIPWLKTLLKFVGPGYMIAVGYLDPGNWATDLSAGSVFGYDLLFVILLSNFFAVLLQTLCIKLGVITGRDLAESCRKYYPRYIYIPLYILCELAIIATDLAEVIGSAIALNLLFGIKIIWGVLITAFDVFFLLLFWSPKNMRIFEFFIIVLVYSCAICLLALVHKSDPEWGNVFYGFVPQSSILTNSDKLYLSMGILGATVMPHNLYLHSSLVKYRSSSNIGEIRDITDTSNPKNTQKNLKEILMYTCIDSVIALTFALIVNASILVISATVFNDGETQVAELSDAYALLEKSLGKTAATLFAFALLCSGQSSTITGTLAGQYVMTGFLGHQYVIAPWIRRILTRLVAIVPPVAVLLIYGEHSLNNLLILSQVILSIQLPFAIWPLVHFTNSKVIMTLKLDKLSDINETPLELPPQEVISNTNSEMINAEIKVTEAQNFIENQQHIIIQNSLIESTNPICETLIDDTLKTNQVPQGECYANGTFFSIIMVIIAMLISALNIILIVQIAKNGILK